MTDDIFDEPSRAQNEPGGIVHRALAEPLEFPGGDGLTLEGYAAVFNRTAHIVDHLGEYDEVIKPGAFKRSINARAPFFLYQHGKHPLFGPYPLGTIETLREDQKGLFVQARLTDTWLTKPIRDAIESGAVTGMSVAMDSPRGKAVWSNGTAGTRLRSVHEARLFELGPVLGEAYKDTSVTLRHALGGLETTFPDYFAENPLDQSELRDQITVLTTRLDAIEEGTQDPEAPAPVERTAEGTETPDTPEAPAAGTAEGPVTEVAEPASFDQRQQRARQIVAERKNIRSPQ